MEKLGPTYVADGNVKWYRICRKLFGSLSKYQTQLSYDPTIPSLGIHPKEICPHKNTLQECSQQYHSQQPRTGSNPNANPQNNKQMDYGTFIEEYQTPMKTNDLDLHKTIQMNSTNMMLNKRIKNIQHDPIFIKLKTGKTQLSWFRHTHKTGKTI